MSQLNTQTEREHESPLPSNFFLFRPSVGWMMPTHIGEGILDKPGWLVALHLTQSHGNEVKFQLIKYFLYLAY